MASLLRNSRSIITGFAAIRRTATTLTANAGTQPKTTAPTLNPSQGSRSAPGGNLAVRDAQRRVTPADPIKPRAAGEPPLLPLVGTALNAWGRIGLGIVLALSAYFIYINYITNPEFYKSLSISREASKRDSHSKPHNRAEPIGQKIDNAAGPKVAHGDH